MFGKKYLLAVLLVTTLASSSVAENIEIISCGAQPNFYSTDNKIEISIAYSANVTNVGETYIKETGFSWDFGQSPLNYSTSATLNIAPGESTGVFKSNYLWNQRNILKEELGAQIKMARTRFDKLWGEISGLELKCK